MSATEPVRGVGFPIRDRHYNGFFGENGYSAPVLEGVARTLERTAADHCDDDADRALIADAGRKVAAAACILRRIERGTR